MAIFKTVKGKGHASGSPVTSPSKVGTSAGQGKASTSKKSKKEPKPEKIKKPKKPLIPGGPCTGDNCGRTAASKWIPKHHKPGDKVLCASCYTYKTAENGRVKETPKFTAEEKEDPLFVRARGRDVGPEMAPLYKQMMIDASRNDVKVVVDSSNGAIKITFPGWAADTSHAAILRDVAVKKILPPVSLVGYVYCLGCWYSSGAIVWSIYDPHARSQKGTGYCEHCKAIDKKKVSKRTKDRRKSMEEQFLEKLCKLSDEPILALSPAQQAVLSAVATVTDDIISHRISPPSSFRAAVALAAKKAWDSQ